MKFVKSLSLTCLGLLLTASSAGAIVLSEEDLTTGETNIHILNWISSGWKYQLGDDPSWREPAYDDTGWDSLATRDDPWTIPDIDWAGLGWFRLNLSVEPTLLDQPLVILYSQYGAMELYLDGERIYGLGKVGDSEVTEEAHLISANRPRMIPIRFSHHSDHVIAIRYSNFWSLGYRHLDPPALFSLAISRPSEGLKQLTAHNRTLTVYQMLFCVPLAFALLHLLLFLFYPQTRENLYYAAFTASIAALVFSPFQAGLQQNLTNFLVVLWVFKLSLILTAVSGVYFLYQVFFGSSPRFFKVLLTIGIILLLLAWFIPVEYVYVFVITALAEMLRIIFIAACKRKEGSRIIGAGCLVFVAACTYQVLMEVQMVEQNYAFPYIYGILCFVVSMSIHLARRFAQTSKDLKSQLIQVQELSGNLEEANARLEGYSQTLEQRVDARTREVNEKNVKLEETLHRLGESEERFRSLTQSASDAIVVADSYGIVVSLNRGAERIFGYREEEVLGKALSLLMPERYREAHLRGINRMRTTGESKIIGKAVELHGLRKDGSEFPLELSLATWTTGEKTFYGGIIRDIAERKQAEEDLKEKESQLVVQEKMASLGSLVAGVAHEINTPVGAINSMHDTLVRGVDKLKGALRTSYPVEFEENRTVQSAIRVIDDANRVISTGTDRVTEIVRSLRTFARLDEAEMQRVDIHEGINNTLTLVHHDLKNRIEVAKDFGEIPKIICYPSRLNQVFLNLLVNGAQAIEGEGQITISTRLVNDMLHVAFNDTGAGIPEENLGKVFVPGFTTKGVGVGTGLGLSICYQIIQDHQGEIQVQSKVGEGTTFTVILPIDLKED